MPPKRKPKEQKVPRGLVEKKQRVGGTFALTPSIPKRECGVTDYMSCGPILTEPQFGLQYLEIPAGVMIYKGMGGDADPEKYWADMDRKGVAYPSYFGLKKTACGYMDIVWAAHKGSRDPPCVFVFQLKRPAKLFLLTDKENVRKLIRIMEAQPGLDYAVSEASRAIPTPLGGAIQDIRFACGVDIKIEEQAIALEEHGGLKMRTRRGFTIPEDIIRRGSADCIDTAMVKNMCILFKQLGLDGYIGAEVPSPFHRPTFHEELVICVASNLLKFHHKLCRQDDPCPTTGYWTAESEHILRQYGPKTLVILQDPIFNELKNKELVAEAIKLGIDWGKLNTQELRLAVANNPTYQADVFGI